ncbi:MAG: hypothetical protein AAGF79_02210 [Pseudomonadota bacterium]
MSTSTSAFKRLAASTLALAALISPGLAHSQPNSAGSLTFGPGNTLFVGDTFGDRIFAFDLSDVLSDQSGYPLGRAETFEGRAIVADLKAELGAKVSAPASQIAINDVTVHSGTGQIFVSASRGLGPDALPILATVDDGALRVLDLARLPSTVHMLETPVADGSLEFGQLTRSYAITDIDYFDGEIFVAGVSGESFNSTLRRVPFPFGSASETETQIEIWHAVHGQWETRAPIIAQTIAILDGVETLVAVYACTPLVRIPLSDLRDGAEVRGEMIGELGYGNSPIDLVPFTNAFDGAPNILVTHTHRSANQIALADIASADPMPVEVPMNFGPDGLVGQPVPLSGAQHLAMINDSWAVIVRPDPENPDVLQLRSLLAPFFFDRTEHMVEMNWPGAPDPYGYRNFPPLDL